MWYAYALAKACMRSHYNKFSRKDFTLPQLFACLIVREHQKKSYRDIETLLRDSDYWCKRIGMRKVPDHNRLQRAFHALLRPDRTKRLMDRLLAWMSVGKAMGLVCAIDSTLYDTHHRSRHYEQRCRHYSTCAKTSLIPGDPARPVEPPSWD